MMRDYVYFSAQRAFNNGDTKWTPTPICLRRFAYDLRPDDLDVGAGYSKVNQVNNILPVPASTVNVNSTRAALS